MLFHDFEVSIYIGSFKENFVMKMTFLCNLANYRNHNNILTTKIRGYIATV